MRPLPYSSGLGKGKIGETLDLMLEHLRAREPVASPGTLYSKTSRGVARSTRVNRSTANATLVVAQVVAEGQDALICTLDGGDTEFYVMKPEPLRLKWMLAANTLAIYGAMTLGVSQETDQALWDAWGYIARVQDTSELPTVIEENQVVWPPWVDNVGGSTAVNAVRAANHAYARYANVTCLKGGASWYLDDDKLNEVLIGDTLTGELATADYVDITPGRAWTPVAQLMQEQAVVSGGVIGYVDNSPLNT